MTELQQQIEQAFDNKPAKYGEEHFSLFARFKLALNTGQIRSAEPDSATVTGWRVNAWVKKGILLGFRLGAIVDMSIDASRLPFFDKATYPLKTIGLGSGVRIVHHVLLLLEDKLPRVLGALELEHPVAPVIETAPENAIAHLECRVFPGAVEAAELPVVRLDLARRAVRFVAMDAHPLGGDGVVIKAEPVDHRGTRMPGGSVPGRVIGRIRCPT